MKREPTPPPRSSPTLRVRKSLRLSPAVTVHNSMHSVGWSGIGGSSSLSFSEGGAVAGGGRNRSNLYMNMSDLADKLGEKDKDPLLSDSNNPFFDESDRLEPMSMAENIMKSVAAQRPEVAGAGKILAFMHLVSPYLIDTIDEMINTIEMTMWECAYEYMA